MMIVIAIYFYSYYLLFLVSLRTLVSLSLYGTPNFKLIHQRILCGAGIATDAAMAVISCDCVIPLPPSLFLSLSFSLPLSLPSSLSLSLSLSFSPSNPLVLICREGNTAKLKSELEQMNRDEKQQRLNQKDEVRTIYSPSAFNCMYTIFMYCIYV